jgi:hypothetical protein
MADDGVESYRIDSSLQGWWVIDRMGQYLLAVVLWTWKWLIRLLGYIDLT